MYYVINTLLEFDDGLVLPLLESSFFVDVSLSLSDDTDSTDDWLEEQEEALLSSITFFGGGPFCLFVLFLFPLSFEFESSFSTTASTESLSSPDFVEVLLLLSESLVLLIDLLSESDSELLSGENILFFFKELVSVLDFEDAFDDDFGVLEPELLDIDFPLARTITAGLGFAEPLLLGGKGMGPTNLGVSSSLEDEPFPFEDLPVIVPSFLLLSSVLVGDFGTGILLATGVSDVEESESELLDADPELDEELSLLLESEDDPELLSVLLLLTFKELLYIFYKYTFISN